MMNKALFWDFDGTLTYSKSLWSNAVLKALQSSMDDCPFVLDDIRPHLRHIYPWHMPDADLHHLIDDGWWDFMFAGFAGIYRHLGVQEAQADVISYKVKDYVLSAANYTLYDDAIPTLGRCIALGYRNYIVSNNYPELPLIVEQLGLAPFFSDYIISALIGYDKPRREVFEHAMDLARHPECCFMIGDNPVADIEGANRVGIPSVLVHQEEASEATYSFASLTEILGIL